ncbi:unnamed protein product [Acanthoscelides obtectus]|uniref:Reverse transcriptase domain-containing protein n=1 Tax=Acanthoscelides obtectus TaxID=200917 RepID=A0A9P0QHY1_ACAOB|nr:unnamed protein product [Acanthoscelides obtectus]CAK1683989.1 hypothetical protein AOBTE_LOCUS34568 [Acanthoscelides obtectus]
MDDLKLFASSNKQLDRELDIVKRFSEDICMQFGLEKCKRITITRGKISMNVNQITENSAGFDYLDPKTSLNPEAKITPMQDLVGQWKAKPLHGRYRSRIDDNAIDTKASQGWLQSGNLFLETEGFIASIQDQVVPTKLYRKRIKHENVEDIRCSICGEKDEHIDDIVAG